MRHLLVKHGDLWLDIKFEYSPEEPMVMHDSDMAGYPGCGASVDIVAVYINELSPIDVSDIVDLRVIESIVWDNIEKDGGYYDEEDR